MDTLKESEKDLTESLICDIKKWAGVDVQIIHRFNLIPDIIDGSPVIKIYDGYKSQYLKRTNEDGKTEMVWAYNLSGAMRYLRRLYAKPLADDEEYDVIVKKKEKGSESSGAKIQKCKNIR